MRGKRNLVYLIYEVNNLSEVVTSTSCGGNSINLNKREVRMDGALPAVKRFVSKEM